MTASAAAAAVDASSGGRPVRPSHTTRSHNMTTDPQTELTETQKAYNVAQSDVFQLAAYGHHRYHPSGECLTDEGKRRQVDYNDRIRAAREELEAALLRLVAEHGERYRTLPEPIVGWLRTLADDPAEVSLLAVAPDELEQAGLTAAAPAVSSPPPDQTLRDRIAEAVRETVTRVMDLRGFDTQIADAVLAVLPPPADRATVLREAADAIEAEQARLEGEERARFDWVDRETVSRGEAVRAAAALLRRLADEAQPETLPSIHANDVQGFCPACGHGVLMLGEGGHIVCTLIDCPNPDAADELLRGAEAQQSEPAAAAPSARAGLRDEIADALEAADYRMDMRRGDLADAVMPVLYRAWPWLRAEAEDVPAAGAQQPETRGCPDPIECSHEAALGQARATNRRLNLRAQRLESELAHYRRAVGQWEVSKRGTYIPHSSLRAIGKACGVDILGSVRHLKHFERVEQAEAAIGRVRRLHDRLAEETDLASSDDPITRGTAAKRIAAALDGWTPPAVPVQPAAADTGRIFPGMDEQLRAAGGSGEETRRG